MLARLSSLPTCDGASDEEADSATLDRLDGMDEDGCQQQVRRAQLREARKVKALAARNAARNAAFNAQKDEEGLPAGFGVQRSSCMRSLTTTDVHREVFERKTGATMRSNDSHASLHRHLLQVTVYRYLWHQREAFQRALAALPVQDGVTVASIRFKWDETQQNIAMAPDFVFATGAEEEMGLIKKAPRTVHVMTLGVWLRLGGSVQPWASLMVHLERTTAECLWLALQSAFAWKDLPPEAAARFLWLVFCGDEASSNKRLYAQVVQHTQGLRPGTLAFFSPCYLHILHRCSVPLMSGRGDLLNNFFRCGNVLSQGCYWSALTQSIRKVFQSIVVRHFDLESDAQEYAFKEDLLRMTVCKNLPDDHISNSTKALATEVQQCFVGDWTSQTVTVACRRPGCSGGQACREKAIDHATHLAARLFASKLAVPTLGGRNLVLRLRLRFVWVRFGCACTLRPLRVSVAIACCVWVALRTASRYLLRLHVRCVSELVCGSVMLNP